jgi:hypothetical protein
MDVPWEHGPRGVACVMGYALAPAPWADLIRELRLYDTLTVSQKCGGRGR